MTIPIETTDLLRIQLNNARIRTAESELVRIRSEQEAALLQAKLAEAEETLTRQRLQALNVAMNEFVEELKRKYDIEATDRIDLERGVIEKAETPDSGSVPEGIPGSDPGGCGRSDCSCGADAPHRDEDEGRPGASVGRGAGDLGPP